MTFLMISFSILILICMVLLNPASKIVDQVLVAKQPWSIEAVDAPGFTKIDMASGTKIKLHIQGGTPDIQPWAESSDPSIASIAYLSDGIWLHAHKNGNATVFLKIESEFENRVARLGINSITAQNIILSMDQQVLKPGKHEVYLSKNNRSSWLSYQWLGMSDKILHGVATPTTQSMQLLSDQWVYGSGQNIGYQHSDASSILECKILEQSYVFHSVSANEMQICGKIKKVSAMDYFTKATLDQKSIRLDFQLKSTSDQTVLTSKEISRPTEIRWRYEKGDFFAWTRPYEKDKPITYIVQQTMDENMRWCTSIILHPSVTNKSNDIVLQVRHRDFSNRTLSLEDSLWIPAYEFSFQTGEVENDALVARWM